MSKPTTWQFNLILCQVVMTKTLTGYDVMVCKDVMFAFKNVIIERKTLNDSCHKHA